MKGFRIRRLPVIIQNMEITAEEFSNFGLKPRVLQPIHIATLKKLTKDLEVIISKGKLI